MQDSGVGQLYEVGVGRFFAVAGRLDLVVVVGLVPVVFVENLVLDIAVCPLAFDALVGDVQAVVFAQFWVTQPLLVVIQLPPP